MVLTKRDINLLQDVARCRMLTFKQIRRLYFNSGWYIYRRMERLKEEGLITTKALMGPHGKETVCVYLTEAGAREAGVGIGRARDNIVSHLQHWRAGLSEIYVRLKARGWDWIDSREAKQKYNLYRGDVFGGVLKHPKGEEFYVYLTGPEPQPETVMSIQGEIARNLSTNTSIRSVIIFAPNREALHLFRMQPMGAKSIMLLEHPEGIETLRKLTEPSEIINAPGLSLDDRSFEPVQETFAQMSVRQRSRQHYLTELLTNDQVRVYHLGLYSYERALENDKKGVFVLVEAEEERYYREEAFPADTYPHFQIVPASRQWLESG